MDGGILCAATAAAASAPLAMRARRNSSSRRICNINIKRAAPTSLPPLRRPQPPPPPPPAATEKKKCEDGDDDRQEEEKGKRWRSSSTPSDVLRLMDVLRVPVDADLYLSLLAECANSRDALQAAAVHAHILRSRQPLLLLLANRLLVAYAACHRPHSARQLFDQMPTRDATSWKAMMASLIDGGSHTEALRLFVEMLRTCAADDDVFPDAAAMVLCSCVRSGRLRFGQQLHALVVKKKKKKKKMAPLGSSGRALVLRRPLTEPYGLLGCRRLLLG